MRPRKTICTLIALVGLSNAKDTKFPALRANRHDWAPESNRNSFIHKPTNLNSRNRSIQSTIPGACKSSTMSPGELIKSNEYILCYPMPSSADNASPTHKFGIDSSNTLSYYVHDTLIWKAIPIQEEESTACIVFGNCESPPMEFFRLQNSGSLVGYDGSTVKIWDSHENVEGNGEYVGDGLFWGDGSTDAVGDKIYGSTLFLNEDGVFIESPAQEVTWMILSPEWEAPTVSPVAAPSLSPVIAPTTNPTAPPTNLPTAPPTMVPTSNPTQNPNQMLTTVSPSISPTNEGIDGTADADGGGAGALNPTLSPTVANDVDSRFVGVSGRVFLNEDVTDSSIVDNIVVDLYDCPDSGDSTWIVVTRTNDTGYYVIKDDNSPGDETDLSTLLATKNITKFRAVFSGLSLGYTFSPAVSGSDVNYDGQTACWDLENNGHGSIVWHAGVMISGDNGNSTNAPVNQPTPNPVTAPTDAPVGASSTLTPTTKSPTMKPSINTTTNEPTSSIGLIGGYAFFDADNNGMHFPDSSLEPAVTNIDVELISCGNTASNFDDDVKLAVDKTNAEGMYIFRNLTSGYYRVNVIAPEGYTFSSVWSGSTENGELTDPDADSTVDPGTGSTPCFRVIKGSTDLSWSVGLRFDSSPSPNVVSATPSLSTSEAPTLSPVVIDVEANSTIVISGVVFFDEDGNGYFDETEEESISSVDVALFDCNGTLKLVSSTDENGMYGFGNLTHGPYQMKFSPPTGYEFSNIWSGAVNEEGKLSSPNANSDVDPTTGQSVCKVYTNSVHTLDAGMILAGDVIPTGKPTNNPKGDGTPCSGSTCPDEGTCRNSAGVCGSGLSFCNPQSVWTPDCADMESKSPSLSPITVEPTVSIQPTISQSPSQSPSVFVESVCNKDESTYGKTTLNSVGTDEAVIEQGVSFTYSLLNESGEPFDDAVAQFEKELNLQLACIYFDDSCLECSARLRRRLMPSQSRRLVVEGSDVVGLSSRPVDEQNLAEACAFPNYNCRVMVGRMTSYFPAGTPLEKVINDTNQMLGIISDEMARNDWTGVTVSYNNKPIGSSANAKEPEEESDNGGLTTGAIVGIILSAVALATAIIALVIFLLRGRREKEQENLQPRVIPYGDEVLGSRSFGDDDSDSESSSSSEDEISGPSFVSGGDLSFPTTAAHANPSEIEEDESSSSGTSSGSDDEESVEYEMRENENNVHNLKTSASSEEGPPIYEQDDMANYNQFPDQYEEQFHDDQNNYDTQEQYESDPRRYGHDEGSNGSGGSIGSMNSADPPGRSFRDLHQEGDWNYVTPNPQLMAPPPNSNNIIESPFYVDETPQVYEQDETSNPGSFHSNASHRSNRSRSKSREHQTSYHSFYNDEEDYAGDVNQQGSNGPGERHEENNFTDYDQQIPQDNPFDYEQYYNDQQYNHDAYNSPPPPHEEPDAFHPQSHSQYDDGDVDYGDVDYGDETTTYSDSTRQASNVNQNVNTHEVEHLSEASSGHSYEEEEEESISHIFKSLSEIQSKLAKKGKTTSSRKISSRDSNSLEGVVEDVSIDGSQMTSFEDRAAKTRRPQNGAWMEPVDEYE